MLSVQCPSCASSFKLAENRVPAKGLNMRCPKCSASFRVMPTGETVPRDGAKKKASKAPAAAAPPAPAPFKVKRPSQLAGRNGAKSGAYSVKRPTAAGVFSGDDVDLPAPKRAPGPPEVDLPAPVSSPKPKFSGPGPGRPPPAPVKAPPVAPTASAFSESGVDLPAPAPSRQQPAWKKAGESGLGVVDLPAPVPPASLPKRPPAAASAAAPSAFSESAVDLPAPVGPRGSAGAFSESQVDLPAPVPPSRAGSGAVELGEEIDLPAVRPEVPASPFAPGMLAKGGPAKGGMPKGGLVPTAPEEIDLPAPREEGKTPFDRFDPSQPPPPPGGLSDLDLPQLRDPQPVATAGAPAESFGELDLPMVKEMADLPAPKADVDLPALAADLPAPRVGGGGLDELDLPMPGPPTPGGTGPSRPDEAEVSFGDLDLPGLKDGDGGIVDLPDLQPLDSNLPKPQRAEAGTDLPVLQAPGGGLADLPEPQRAEMDFGDIELPVPQAPDGGALDLPLPAPGGFGPEAALADDELELDVPEGAGGVQFGEIDLGGGDDEMEFDGLPEERTSSGLGATTSFARSRPRSPSSSRATAWWSSTSSPARRI